MKKFLTISLIVGILVLLGYFLFVYYVPYSEGYRSGELVKISNRGVVFKTWEGRLSQGVSESQHFDFSVEEKEKVVLEQLKELQGHHVKLTYIERFGTFPWMGDTKYYITSVEKTSKE
ncbi:6-phosphogluconate dehydrogenase [Namhaeicola litoreus]|uniref:6-phosphogluconate dehydrogenase n=1 Tax=Namhaeicola litoreus TaxID=1052145 RepID=A0ABW3Y0N9_9FLAO